MRGILSVEFRFHWGFWARAPIFSARQPTMSLPPPTTLVGALARGVAQLARARGVPVPEVILRGGVYEVPLAPDIAKCIAAVYYRVLEGVVTTAVDKTRYFQAPYIRGENLEDRSQWFGVRDVGKAYAPGVTAEAAFLIDADCPLKPKELAVAAHSITRIGPAEGVVAVERVSFTPLEECKDGLNEREPCPYFPLRKDVELPDPWAEAEFLDWHDVRTWTSRRAEAEKVRYAVPVGAWAASQPEFPHCATLRGKVNFKICGGRTYPYDY